MSMQSPHSWRRERAETGQESDVTVIAEVSESVAGAPLVHRLIVRPEIGAALGAAAVCVFFSLVTDKFLSPLGIATWLDDASSLGIVAVAVALLMIGGEFDLSAGVMTGSTALVTALLAVHVGWNVWLALLVSLVFALAVGALNGWLVMWTRLPSFIVTLGTFLALQGINLGVTRLVTGTVQLAGIRTAAGYSSAGSVVCLHREHRRCSHSGVDPVVDRAHDDRRSRAGAHPIRQLGLRPRRLTGECTRVRRAGRAHQGRTVHDHRSRRVGGGLVQHPAV
jgi:hypothetical protein